MLQSRQRQHALHAFSFGFGYRFAQLGQPVIAPPLVVEAEVRALRRLLDHVVIEKPLDDAVERAGAQLNFVVGAARDFLADDVAMFFAIGERQQHVKHRRGQRQIRFDRFLLSHRDPLRFGPTPLK